MKRILITLLFLTSIVYAQNVSITKVDIDRVFTINQGSRLFDNAVFSASDTLLVKTSSYITAKLSKYQGSLLSISKVNGIYVGRIFKKDIMYFELKVGTVLGTYNFIKLNANKVEDGAIVDNLVAKTVTKKSYASYTSKASVASRFMYEDLLKFDNELSSQDIKNSVSTYNSYGIPVDDDLALVQSGWGCVFLDMDGQFVSSSMWNYGTPFYCNPVTFINSSDSVNYIKNRVKQLFYPFSLVVTIDSTIYFAAPPDKRMRVIVTPTSAWYPGVAAISYVTSFTWGDNTPCFAFSNVMGNNLKTVSFACGRTPAQTMGLYAQSKYDSTTCTLTQAQSNGFGTGETSWSPLMGTINTKNAITFSNGPTPNGCQYRQDNISIVATTNGLPNGGYRFSSTPQNYASFTLARGQGAGEKSILQPNFMPATNDSASFKIVVSKLGTTTITASPLSDGPSNDGARMKLEARLYNLSGNLVAQTDPLVNSLSATFSQAIPPGTYYLVVRKGELPQTSAPAFFISRGYGQYGWFSVTMD